MGEPIFLGPSNVENSWSSFLRTKDHTAWDREGIAQNPMGIIIIPVSKLSQLVKIDEVGSKTEKRLVIIFNLSF